jgi:peptidoglycan/LPS O-acetylase OafA/YrhL
LKKRLLALDGLRGVAAVAVVAFHLQEQTSHIWFRHAYLAVDFFFCLSGYVIGYTYDGQRDSLSVPGFFSRRLIRLHPLVILGAFLGLASYVLNPWALTRNVGHRSLALAALGGMLLIPTHSLPGTWGAYLPLNIPSWSLMWEYLANVAFGLVFWRMRRNVLIAILSVAAVAMVILVRASGDLEPGPAWGQMDYSLVRTAFSFTLGLLLVRLRLAIASPMGFGSLSLALLVCLWWVPTHRWNWVYEAAVVMIVFPLIISLGAGMKESSATNRLCLFAGRISYPIYILHYGFVRVFAGYVLAKGANPHLLPFAVPAMLAAIVLFSYAALVFYDEPIRERLTRFSRQPRILIHRQPALVQNG